MKHKLFLELGNRAPTNSPQHLCFIFLTDKSVADNHNRVGFVACNTESDYAKDKKDNSKKEHGFKLKLATLSSKIWFYELILTLLFLCIWLIYRIIILKYFTEFHKTKALNDGVRYVKVGLTFLLPVLMGDAN